MNISPIKEAWRSMYHNRTCPPSCIVNDPTHALSMAEHLSNCPLCVVPDGTSAEADAWAELGRRLVHEWPAPTRPAITPGQVWSLSFEKGGWDERFRYINPPLVLVLDVFEDVCGVRVLQIFDHSELAADGDVPLDDGLGFAEAWNSYALDQADLDLCFGQVREATLCAVRQAQEAELCNVDEESTLWFFRQLELEVGAFMAMEAMGRLMMRHERNAVREAFADTRAVRAKVLTFDPRIVLPEAEDGLQMLAQGQFPDMAMAASSTDGLIPVVVVSAGANSTVCRSHMAEIKQSRIDGSIIRITGVLPPETREGLLFAWWRRTDKGLQEGATVFDQHSGIFRADFDNKTELDFALGTLVLMLVTMDDEDA